MRRFDQTLSFADYWLRDGLRICGNPGFFVSVEVDMTPSQTLIERLRADGLKVTYTHLFVKATAITLSRCPELHRLVIGRHQIYPSQVDIGLSVAGSSMVAPIMVIRDPTHKTLKNLAEEIRERTPEVRQQDEQLNRSLRRWGWLVPFGWLRRWLLRQLMDRPQFRLAGTGTFQVSCLPSMDVFVPFLFNTSAILGVGRVRERAIVSNHQISIKPTVILSCCADHKVWNGVDAARFLTELAKLLESETLEQEMEI
jgi:pyruvate dehydrogenase E2 component (dihydrolipoamide acetyltransferase)